MKDGLLQCLKQKIPIHIIYEDIITNTHRRGRSGHGGMLGGRSRSTGRHVHRWRQDLPAQRPALRSQGGRAALSAHTAPLLGAPHQDVQGIGYEHRVPLRLLEHPRAARGRVRLHRAERHSRVLPPCAEERHVRNSAPRALRLRRMGDGRTALVALEEEGHTPARARPLLHGARREVHGEGGRAACAAYHTARRPHNHGAGGE